MKLLFSSIIVVIMSFSNAVAMDKTEISTKNQDLLTGQWGWNKEQCESNPATVSFSSDGSILYWDTQKGMYLGDETKALTRIEYVISSQKYGVLHTSIKGEDRLDDKGNPVKWDLVVQSKSTFCWHREDWPKGSCTTSMIRCK